VGTEPTTTEPTQYPNFNRELGDLTAKDAKSAKEEGAGRLAAKRREKTRRGEKKGVGATVDFADGADEGGGKMRMTNDE
jgi:hypothetical protein